MQNSPFYIIIKQINNFLPCNQSLVFKKRKKPPKKQGTFAST